MSFIWIRTLLPAAAGCAFAVVGLAALSQPAGAIKAIDETKPASPTGTVVIESVLGSVVVTGSDKAEVTVQGRYDDEATLTFESGENQTTIKVKWPKDHGFDVNLHDPVCELKISVPQASEVQASTVSAGLSVSAVKGALELETVSGGLTVEGQPGSVKAKSVSGEVKILASTTRLNAESVSGDVLVRQASGDAKVSSVSGEIRIEGGSFQQVKAQTVSGDLKYDGALSAGAECDFSSQSGDVVLTLPASLSADIQAETFSGAIESDFGGKAERSHGRGRLDLSVGSGDGRIKVNSFSGEVRFRKKR